MSPAGASANETPTAADRLKVVVLEDDDLDAGYLTRLLERLWPGGVEIERYLTVSELEARLPTQHPAVVLTDLGLPDGVGLEVVKRVRAVSGVAPVIVLTGNSDPGVAEQALQAGVQDYLVKGSFDADALERSLRHSMSRARSEADLRLTAKALAQSNSQLDAYAGIVAHDLRAPARTARLLADRLIANGDDPARAADLAARLDGCLARLEDLIAGLLEFAALRDESVEYESLQMSTVVACVATDLSADVETMGAVIRCTDDETVRADKMLLIRLLSNLVENSLKYRRDDVAPVVEIAVEIMARQVAIHVTDNGIGIEREYRERVFGLFERLHTDREIPGLGFGLALCRQIVGMHGGAIAVTTPDDHIGTRVTVTLPSQR